MCWLLWKYFDKPGVSYIILGIYINSVFMLTMGQHERYQLPVIAFLILYGMAYTDKEEIWFATLFSFITFGNQFFIYFMDIIKNETIMGYAFLIGSLVNILLLVLLYIRGSYHMKLKKNKY